MSSLIKIYRSIIKEKVYLPWEIAVDPVFIMTNKVFELNPIEKNWMIRTGVAKVQKVITRGRSV